LIAAPPFNADYILLDNPSRLLVDGAVLKEFEDHSKTIRVTRLSELEFGKVYLTQSGNQVERISNVEVILRGAREAIILVTPTQNTGQTFTNSPTRDRVAQPQPSSSVLRREELLRSRDPVNSPFSRRLRQPATTSAAPPSVKDVAIAGANKRSHLGFLNVQYIFENGPEGASVFQWERCTKPNNTWEFIPGANEKSYTPTVEDAGLEVRVRVLPINASNVQGIEAISPPVELTLDNKVRDEVASHSSKKRVNFDVLIGYGTAPVPRTLVVTNSRLEVHHRNRPFTFGDVRVPLKPDSLVFSHPSNPNVVCFHLEPQEASLISSSSVMVRTNSESDLAGIAAQDVNSPGADRKRGTDLELVCESNYERDVVLMTLKARIDQLSNVKKPEEKKQKEVVATGLQYYLTEGDWQLMLTNANEFTYHEGDVIFDQGTPNNSLYRIRSGGVRITKEGKVIGHMGAGSVLGEMSFLGNNVTTAAVIAEGEVRVAEVEVQFIKQLFEVEPLLALKFYRNIAMKLSSRLRGLTGETPERPGASAPVIHGKPSESWDIFARKRKTATDVLMMREYQHCSIDGRSAVCQLYQPKLEFITKVFGFRKRNDIFFTDIENITKLGENGIKIQSKKRKDDKNITFASTKDRDEVFGLVTSILTKVTTGATDASRPVATTAAPVVASSGNDAAAIVTDNATKAGVGQAEAISKNPLSEEEELQEKDDWNTIMSEAERRIYTKGQTILAQGDLYQRLYQVSSGKCVIDINEGVIGEVNEAEIFGEMSFLQLRSASAAITAASDSVELYVIEGYKLNRLIRQNTALGARFFKYIALVLEGRVQKREQQVYAAAASAQQ